MIDDGYIKFNCHWNNAPFSMPNAIFEKINSLRSRLHELGLIGVYKNGVGFGNISCKASKEAFYITGSATGEKAILSKKEYALVTEWNFKQNSLKCTGLTKASSESLSHAAIYESDDTIEAVIHIHSKKMWENYLNVIPTTSKDLSYGTPEMAYALKKISSETSLKKGLLVMGGHEEGIIAYGANLDQAGKILLSYFTNL
jgi:L-ribulose-5-phosphate 4-epimerase